MCGIIGAISKNNKRVGKELLLKYEAQKSRGHEGFGYCAFENGVVKVERAEQEEKIRRKLKHEMSPFVMFHHRFPTSTINVEECTHPIHVSHEELDYDYYVVHNGVLRNEDELKKKHEGYSVPYKYTTELIYSSKSSYKSNHTGQEYKSEIKNTHEFNDSESLAIELARYFDGMSHKIDAVGTIAFICLQTTKQGKFVKLHFGHNSGNPLCLEQDGNNIWIKSVGGKALEEDIIYSYTFKDDGTVEESQVSIDVGYTTEYNRTQGTNYPKTPQYNNQHTRYPTVDYSTNRMGFGLNNDDDWGDDYKGIDTTKDYSGYTELQLDVKVNSMVREFCELSDELNMLETDVTVATDMLLNEDNLSQASLINSEISETKERIKETVHKMNMIEEDYIYKIKGSQDFLDLVEEYQEEQLELEKEMEQYVVE